MATDTHDGFGLSFGYLPSITSVEVAVSSASLPLEALVSTSEINVSTTVRFLKSRHLSASGTDSNAGRLKPHAATSMLWHSSLGSGHSGHRHGSQAAAFTCWMLSSFIV